MSSPKPLIDPEWAARFTRDLERMTERARRDAAEGGRQIAKTLDVLAKQVQRTQKKPGPPVDQD